MSMREVVTLASRTLRVDLIARFTKSCVERWIGSGFLALVLLGSGQAQAQSAGSQNLPAPSGVLQFLSKTIYWYQQTQVEQQVVNEPTDLAFAENNQGMAEQVVRLAFDSARRTAQLLEKQTKPAQPQNNSLSSFNGLNQIAASVDQQLQQTQTELQSLEQQRESARGKNRQQIDSQIEELKSEIALAQARAMALRSMTSFVTGSGQLDATGLRGQIEELARSVPSNLSEPQDKNSNDHGTQAASSSSSTKAAAIAKQPASGIWGVIYDLFHLSLKTRTLKQQIASADSLLQTTNQLRTPLVANLKQLVQTGSQLATQADTSNAAGLMQEKQELDALTEQFKQVSAAAIPLDQQAIVLDLYKRSLTTWEQSVASKYLVDIKNLIFRLSFLAVLLGIVFGLGAVWRRTIFRYVQDQRRRHQLMLVRRVAVWSAIGLVLVFTFASELGSMVTFAGLITAGVAVALQNVIVAVVGYFFLIGKYGIRVGDRVQVSTVTGTVVEIGMVRFFLMELEANAADFQPTGRIVAFSNAIVFQATPGLFKQIPGTSFIWHEIKLTFAADTEHKTARERMSKAVEAGFADYQESLETQQRQMQINLVSVPTAELKPRIRSYFTPAGLEFVIRYPVVFQKAQEIDEHLMGAVFAEVSSEPKLNLIATELPVRVAA